MGENFGLKRVLGLGDLVAIEVGTTIGAGIFVFTGKALVKSGPSLPLCFLAAAVPIVFVMLTLAMMGSALPTVGGTYRYPSRLFSPTWAFVGVWGFALGMVFGCFPLYGISCARYIIQVFPYFDNLDPAQINLWIKGLAIFILTIFYVFNLVGVTIAAIVQTLMVVLLIVALIYFGVTGMPHVNAVNFHPAFPNGAMGFIIGTCMLVFCLLGSNSVIELGGEIKNPRRNMPLSLLIAIPLVTLIYVIIGIVTAGVMPWNPSRDVLLTEPAAVFMGPNMVRAFIFFGAFLAITTTINATYMWSTKSIMIVAYDGLIPEQLCRVSRFGTPHWFLTIIWFLGSVTVLFNVSPETFDVYANIGGIIIFIPGMIAAILLPRKMPEAYEKAAFKLQGIWLWICPIVGCFLSVLIIGMLLTVLKPLPLLFFIAWLVLGYVYYLWMKKKIQKAKGMSMSEYMEQELKCMAHSDQCDE